MGEQVFQGAGPDPGDAGGVTPGYLGQGDECIDDAGDGVVAGGVDEVGRIAVVTGAPLRDPVIGPGGETGPGSLSVFDGVDPATGTIRSNPGNRYLEN